VLGEDLDSFPPASLDRDTQSQGKAANVDADVPRREWLRQEYPKMSTPTAILKSRLHPILTKVEAKLQEVWDGILIIRVDGHPLGALGGGVDCVEADGDFALEVAADCIEREAAPLAGFPVLGPIVIMPGTYRVRPIGLEGVSPTIDEEAEVIRHHSGGRSKAKHWHSLLPEVRGGHHLHNVGGKTRGILCRIDRLEAQ
jgi:hypothetical protein